MTEYFPFIDYDSSNTKEPASEKKTPLFKNPFNMHANQCIKFFKYLGEKGRKAEFQKMYIKKCPIWFCEDVCFILYSVQRDIGDIMTIQF